MAYERRAGGFGDFDQARVARRRQDARMGIERDTFLGFIDDLASDLDDHASSAEDRAARLYLSRSHFDRLRSGAGSCSVTARVLSLLRSSGRSPRSNSALRHVRHDLAVVILDNARDLALAMLPEPPRQERSKSAARRVAARRRDRDIGRSHVKPVA